MPDNDPEFIAAITAFLLARREAGEGFVGSDEEFEEYVDFVLNGNGWAGMFRAFHEMQGRYPTVDEVRCSLQSGPTLILREDKSHG